MQGASSVSLRLEVAHSARQRRGPFCRSAPTGCNGYSFFAVATAGPLGGEFRRGSGECWNCGHVGPKMFRGKLSVYLVGSSPKPTQS